MSWSTTELSTLSSITNIEAEINNMVGTYSRKALQTDATTISCVPNTLTDIVAVKSDNTTATLVYTALTQKWALPAGTYTRFICKTTADDTYFALLEGTGSILCSADGIYTLTLTDAPTWADVLLQYSWQSKIDSAKTIIYDTIYSYLATKADGESIPSIIDSITNMSLLNLASDYKSMELIYIDLYGKIGTKETIDEKLSYYRNAYSDAIDRAMIGLDFGNYGYIFQSRTGRLVR